MTPIEEGSIGNIGTQSIDLVDGKLVAKAHVDLGPLAADLAIVLSPKAVLDAIAAKVGGPIPAEVAAFLEAAFGLK